MTFKDFEIIDFHTHPFTDNSSNICTHKEHIKMDADTTLAYLQGMGISKICGSPLCSYGEGERDSAETMRRCNDMALMLWEKYGDFYIPGFHVHTAHLQESLSEMERMHSRGVRVLGELVPYWYGWTELYGSDSFSAVLDLAEDLGLIVSVHSMDDDGMDKMVKEHPGLTIIGAHPGEYGDYARQIERMGMSENYYVDLSGYGLFRQGMLRYGIDKCGIDRFIFGSDYPTCNPAMYIGGVLLDTLITDSEKEAIFAGNIKRLLSL